MYKKIFILGQTANVIVNGKNIGIIGRIHPNMTDGKVFVSEINLSDLLEIKTGKMKYKEISKFPSIKKDIALVIDKNIEAETISKAINKAGGKNLSNVEIFDIYEGKGIEDGKRSIAFSLTFSSSDKTLTDEEINPAIDKIIEMAGKEFKAVLRG